MPASLTQKAVNALFHETFNVNYHAHASVTGLKSSTYTIGLEVTPKRLSVFNFPRGTNNDAEAFHS